MYYIALVALLGNFSLYLRRNFRIATEKGLLNALLK